MTHGEVALVVIAGCTAVAAWLAFEQLAKPRRAKSEAMSYLGEMHKLLMRKIEDATFHVLSTEAYLEHGAAQAQVGGSLRAAREFLVDAQKLAIWIDSGGAFEPAERTKEPES